MVFRLESGQPYAHVIDDRTLREAPVDREAAERWLRDGLMAVDRDRQQGVDPDAERPRRALLGSVARMLGELDVAAAQLTRSRELCETDAQRVLARVRLAHVWQWQERFEEAETEMRRCLAEGAGAGLGPLHMSFIEQHLGKCLFDQGRWQEAADLFERALRTREEATDPGSDELVASSRVALERALAYRDG